MTIGIYFAFPSPPLTSYSIGTANVSHLLDICDQVLGMARGQGDVGDGNSHISKRSGDHFGRYPGNELREDIEFDVRVH